MQAALCSNGRHRRQPREMKMYSCLFNYWPTSRNIATFARISRSLTLSPNSNSPTNLFWRGRHLLWTMQCAQTISMKRSIFFLTISTYFRWWKDLQYGIITPRICKTGLGWSWGICVERMIPAVGSDNALTSSVANGSRKHASLPTVDDVDAPNTAARSAKRMPGYIIDTGVKLQAHEACTILPLYHTTSIRSFTAKVRGVLDL